MPADDERRLVRVVLFRQRKVEHCCEESQYREVHGWSLSDSKSYIQRWAPRSPAWTYPRSWIRRAVGTLRDLFDRTGLLLIHDVGLTPQDQAYLVGMSHWEVRSSGPSSCDGPDPRLCQLRDQ